MRIRALVGDNERPRISARAKARSLNDHLVPIRNCKFLSLAAAALILDTDIGIHGVNRPGRKPGRPAALFDGKSYGSWLPVRAERANVQNVAGGIHRTRSDQSNGCINRAKGRSLCEIRNNWRDSAVVVNQTG